MDSVRIVAEAAAALAEGNLRPIRESKLLLTQGDAASDDEDANDVEDDLLLAYESLELARRCLQLQPGTATTRRALARVHFRLGDFNMIQSMPLDAVSEYQASLTLSREANLEDRATAASDATQASDTEALCPVVKDTLDRLLRAVESSRRPMSAVVTEDYILQMMKDRALAVEKELRKTRQECTSASTETKRSETVVGFSDQSEGLQEGRAIVEVQVRSRKRLREHNNADESTHP